MPGLGSPGRTPPLIQMGAALLWRSPRNPVAGWPGCLAVLQSPVAGCPFPGIVVTVEG